MSHRVPFRPTRAEPRYRFLVATADPDVLAGVRPLLEAQGCEVLAAAGGVDCLELLRAFAPDVVVLIPPLLWGSAEGVLEVMQHDPALHRVPALVVANAGEAGLPPVAFYFFPDPAGQRVPLERLTGRLCRWLRGRPAGRAVALASSSAS